MINDKKILPKNNLCATAFLIGNMVIAYPVSAEEVSSAVTTKNVIGNGSGLEVTSGGSISVTGDNAVESTGTVTSIINNGTITTDINGFDAIVIDGLVSGSITNNGTISNKNSDNDDDSGIEIDQGYVTGTITNNGTITSSADNGIAVWGDNDNDQSDNRGVVLGGIVNNGTITGYNEGIDIDDDARINNGITNNGTITGKNASAIEIDEDSVVNGGILNNSSGVIKSNSNSSAYSAIDISSSAVLNDGVINYGTIQSNTYGIAIYGGAKLIGGITNYGSITAAEKDAIYLDGELTGGITNHGGIIAADGDGIYLNDELTGGITNYGSITADDDAVSMRGDAEVTGGFINYGTIKGNADGIYLDDGKLTGDITNYGSITAGDDGLDFSGTSDFSGDINNYGTIIGADSSIAFESTAIISGKIFNYEAGKIVGLLEASASGTVDFDNSGLLAVKSSVTSGSERTTGSIGTSVLKGNYVQSSTGEINLAVDSNATFGTTYSQFNIEGSAILSSNAKISLDVKNSGENINNADSFDNVLTTTGTLTSTSFNVTDKIMSLNFTAVNDGGGNIDIAALSTGMTTVEAATTGIGGGAAKVFDNCLANICSDEDFNYVTNEISSLSSAGEVNSAMEQTVPILTGGMPNATMNALHGVNKIIQERLAFNSGLSTEDGFEISEETWLKPFKNWGDQGNRHGVSGYDISTTGMVAGRDTEIEDNIRIGVAFAFAHSDVTSKSSKSQNAVSNMYQVIGYGSYALDEKTEIYFQADAGIIKNKGTRYVSFGAIERDAHANYNTRFVHVGSGFGRTFDIKGGNTLVPSLSADFTWFEDQAYTEIGADSLNLIVDKNSNSSFVLSTDVEYGFFLADGNAISLNAGIGYDFLAEQNTIAAAFQGSPTSSFDTKGLDTSKFSFHVGAGYTMNCGELCEMTMRYDAKIKQEFISDNVSAMLRWVF
jgi:autotransporter family porin